MDHSCPKKEAFEFCFDPKEGLKTYCSFDSTSSEKNDILMFLLRNFFKTFILDGVKGNTLIRIGAQPTIFELLSACESFKEIIVTNHTDLSCQEMQKWLKKEPGAFDWTPVVKYVCELEGDRKKWAEKEEKLRRTVKQVLECDVTKFNPATFASLPPADCLLLNQYLGAICKDWSTYRAALKTVSSLLKPGGHLLMVTTMKCSHFVIDQHKFPCLFLEKECLQEAVKEAGFDILTFEMTPICYPSSLVEHEGISYLVASKGKGKED
ncbi:nicotinamide N-methyltransferase-like [Gopherus flavomarginatus]|uniref:nicotinamide N-methyltransferase-like n=1 Tax=Gopherus flavomarginatus TaxID=286002 RepID=UPI0021CC23B0|nr:nicotinamide N-methyltransferase-like [Gopherus flavomarginatus]